VFGLSRALQVWVHTEPTDMRKSFNTPSALVTEEMGREVLSGDLFVFLSRDRKRALARRKRACRTIWIEPAVALASGSIESDDALRFFF